MVNGTPTSSLRTAAFTALLAAAPASCSSGCTGNPPPPDPPANVLLLILDDVGANEIGVYEVGESPPLTPRIDTLATEGVRFTRAWSDPSCSPSRSSLLTGRYPFRTGVGGSINVVETNYGLPTEEITLAELIRAKAPADYALGFVGKWHLDSVHTGGGAAVLAQGFDRYLGSLGNLIGPDAIDGKPQDYKDFERWTDGELGRVTRHATLVEFDDAVTLMNELPEPWFIVVAFHGAHSPFHTPPPRLLPGPRAPGPTTTREKYEAMVASVDTAVGWLLDAVDARTHVVLVGDNGTPMQAVQAPYTRKTAKLSAYEGGIRVPLIVRSPLVTQRGAQIDVLTHVVDVFSTIADIVGAPPEHEVDGISLVPWLRDPNAPAEDRLLYATQFSPNGLGPPDDAQLAVRDETFKLVRNTGTPDQLFRLGSDWREGEDLLTAGPQSKEVRVATRRLTAALDGLAVD
jgi:arylsulfatase B